MASMACSRIEEIDRKAKQLLSQLKAPGNMKHENLIALKQELQSDSLRQQTLEESTDDIKSEVNTEVLFSVVSNLYELIECLDQKVSELMKEKSALKKDIEDYKIQVEKLTKDLEAQKQDHIQLMLGQLAFEVEKAIINEVLTEIIGSPDEYYVFSIADMQNALKRKANFTDVLADESNLEKANKKWKYLQKTLDWKDYHFRCILHLKHSRVQVAHPKLEASTMKNVIKEGKVGQHKKACNELLEMLEKLQKSS